MKNFIFFFVLSVLTITCSGCGETVRGMGKDAHRIGKGVRTVFVSDE